MPSMKIAPALLAAEIDCLNDNDLAGGIFRLLFQLSDTETKLWPTGGLLALTAEHPLVPQGKFVALNAYLKAFKAL